MTYNPPFLYRCNYDDGKFIERQYLFGEDRMAAFYTRCLVEAEKLPGARIVIECYDRRRRKWRYVLRYINKGGETDGA